MANIRDAKRSMKDMHMLRRMGHKKAGMTRSEWLKGAGLAVAGLGAAAVGLGGTAHATPNPDTSNIIGNPGDMAITVYPTIDPNKDARNIQWAVSNVDHSVDFEGNPLGTVYLKSFAKGTNTRTDFNFFRTQGGYPYYHPLYPWVDVTNHMGEHVVGFAKSCNVVGDEFNLDADGNLDPSTTILGGTTPFFVGIKPEFLPNNLYDTIEGLDLGSQTFLFLVALDPQFGGYFSYDTLEVENPPQVSFRNITFKDPIYSAISLVSTRGATVEHCKFFDCRNINFEYVGLHPEGYSIAIMPGNLLSSTATTYEKMLVTGKINILNNYFDGQNRNGTADSAGMYFDYAGDPRPRKNLTQLSDMSGVQGYKRGVYFAIAHWYTQTDTVISGNKFVNCDSGVFSHAHPAPSTVTIHNNDFTGLFRKGGEFDYEDADKNDFVNVFNTGVLISNHYVNSLLPFFGDCRYTITENKFKKILNGSAMNIWGATNSLISGNDIVLEPHTAYLPPEHRRPYADSAILLGYGDIVENCIISNNTITGDAHTAQIVAHFAYNNEIIGNTFGGAGIVGVACYGDGNIFTNNHFIGEEYLGWGLGSVGPGLFYFSGTATNNTVNATKLNLSPHGSDICRQVGCEADSFMRTIMYLKWSESSGAFVAFKNPDIPYPYPYNSLFKYSVPPAGEQPDIPNTAANFGSYERSPLLGRDIIMYDTVSGENLWFPPPTTGNMITLEWAADSSITIQVPDPNSTNYTVYPKNNKIPGYESCKKK